MACFPSPCVTISVMIATAGGQTVAPSRDDPNLGEKAGCDFSLGSSLSPSPVQPGASSFIPGAGGGRTYDESKSALSGMVAGWRWDVCAAKGEPCHCNGLVRYGWEDQWSEAASVTGSIACNENGFDGADKVTYHVAARECRCLPWGGQPERFSSLAAAEARCDVLSASAAGSAGAGVTAPKNSAARCVDEVAALNSFPDRRSGVAFAIAVRSF